MRSVAGPSPGVAHSKYPFVQWWLVLEILPGARRCSWCWASMGKDEKSHHLGADVMADSIAVGDWMVRLKKPARGALGAEGGVGRHSQAITQRAVESIRGGG